jgi:uncharacterized membrane protein
MRTLRESLAIVGLAFLISSVCVFWRRLPSRVPTHFSASGLPNGFGSKGSVWAIPIVAAIMYGALSTLSLVPTRMSDPAEMTPDQRLRMTRCTAAVTAWLKVEIVWTFAWLNWTGLRVALGYASGLSEAFLPATIGIVFATVAIYAVKMHQVQRKQPTEQA